jgi:hypothetical protein
MRHIQLVLGHESVKTTEKYYAHLAPHHVTDATRVLDKVLDGFPNFFPFANGSSSERKAGEAATPVESVVPKGGVEPPWYQVPRDFESRASASSATSAS